MADNNNINNMLGNLSHQLGVSQSRLEDAAKSGDIKEILKNTDSKSAKRIESVLNDPEKAKQILNSPQAQALLKLLSEE